MKQRAYGMLSMAGVRQNLKTNKYAVWARAKTRLQPEAWPEYEAAFAIEAGSVVFAMGSCFAREIEKELARQGYEVPSMQFQVPANEREDRELLNKYTPPDLFQEVQWCAEILGSGGTVTQQDIEPLLYRCQDNRVIDLQLASSIPVSPERALSRRKEIYQVFAQVFKAQTVILTLGLIEAWYDRKYQRFIQRMPTPEMVNAEGERFCFIRLNYQECFDFIEKTLGLIRTYNPDCNLILTTSPVSLSRTFTRDDVIIANTYSKSVLRAVCGEITESYPRMAYIPSYENVMLTRDWSVYEADLIHVSRQFVAKIMAQFHQTYLLQNIRALKEALRNEDFRKYLELMGRYVSREAFLAEFGGKEANPQALGYYYLAMEKLLQKKYDQADRELARAIDLAPENVLYFQLSKVIGQLIRIGKGDIKCIVFGTGVSADTMVDSIISRDYIAYFVDNDTSKWGAEKVGKPIYPPARLSEDLQSKFIVVASQFYGEIAQQLNRMGFLQFSDFVDFRRLIDLPSK